MKAAQLLAGTDIEREVAFRAPRTGADFRVIFRPISDVEDAEAIAYGVKYAADRGIPNASHGHPLFDKGLRAYTLFVATLDVDSPKEKRERAFSSPEELLKFHPDWVLWLYERWEVVQEETSPLIRMRSNEDLMRSCSQLASDDDSFGFFFGCSPATRAILARFTARLALDSPALKSFYSSQGETQP